MKRTKKKTTQTRMIAGVELDRFKTRKPDIREVWDEQEVLKKHANTNMSVGRQKTPRRPAKHLLGSILKKTQAFNISLKNKVRQQERFHGAKPVFIGLLTIGIILVGLYTFVLSGSKESPKVSTSEILGSQTNNNELPRVIDTEFPLLFTDEDKRKAYEIVRISPEGATPTYAYIDQLEDSQLRVSQQDISSDDRFSQNRDEEMRKIAENFQATNIIQVDDTTVYHGVDDKLGVQSLLFLKDEKLILIASDKQLADDLWAAYISSLK